MNATIERIVNLLFEDLAETEETVAIREEIQQNCQERYQDLREAGISEDDAIHAVIESLNGMEEMLSEYPRKGEEPVKVPETPENEETDKKEDADGFRTWSCDPAQSPIREIRMEHLASADVSVCVSQDDLVHVECSNPKLTLMTGMDNGVLTIALSEQKPEEAKDEIKFSLQDGFDLSGLGRMFEKLAKRFVTSITETEVTLRIPARLAPALHIGTASGSVSIEALALDRLHIGTASGDVDLDSVTMQNELRITSASGDITVTGVQAKQMQLSSTSGDIEASDCIVSEAVRLNTTSGDMNWCDQCQTLDASSISGDITLEGAVENIHFRTVSGDVNLHLIGSHLCTINGKTTSGDVEVDLPSDIQADVHCSTVSGDISNHVSSIPGAQANVNLSTVSGDIEVN